jgi:hypothetical protein
MNWKGFGMKKPCPSTLFQHLPGRTEQNHKNLSLDVKKDEVVPVLN